MTVERGKAEVGAQLRSLGVRRGGVLLVHDEWLRDRKHARLAASRDIVAVALKHLALDPLLFLHPASAGCRARDVMNATRRVRACRPSRSWPRHAAKTWADPRVASLFNRNFVGESRQCLSSNDASATCGKCGACLHWSGARPWATPRPRRVISSCPGSCLGSARRRLLRSGSCRARAMPAALSRP